jgi:hypothetical protein
VPDVRKIPSNNQITRLLDKLEPEWFAETFNNNLNLAERYGALDEYRVLAGGLVLPLLVMNRTGKCKTAEVWARRQRKRRRRASETGVRPQYKKAGTQTAILLLSPLPATLVPG